MIELRTVDEVRAAEDLAFRLVAEGTLMQRAARALSVACARLLTEARGAVVGADVVLLIGSGNNGGDALWAGSMLAARGCRVQAIAMGEHIHEGGEQALRRAGGQVLRWNADDLQVQRAIAAPDLVLDGILGIGGSGSLRPPAADLVARVSVTDALTVAVDVPSGVDADTGLVAGAAVSADVTVTFGAVKPGLLVAPGSGHAGAVHLVDIGLRFADGGIASVLEDPDVATWIDEPADDSYKYRRGVVGIAAGSAAYPGAALLASSAARRANVGMVRFLDRADGAAALVVGRYPDVVVDGSPPDRQPHVTAWGCGPGFPSGPVDEATVLAVLAAAVPVVLDAGALAIVAASAGVRTRILERAEAGLVTVLTPHDGEFDRILPGLRESAAGRIAAAREAAAALRAVIVLKGPGTVVAAPGGRTFVDVEGTSDLGVAGSGDVLTGTVAALLSGAWQTGRRDEISLATATAAAVRVHGRAGRIAAEHAPVTATDVSRCLGAAIRSIRRGDDT